MKRELRQMRARGDPKQGTHHLPTARDVAAQLPLTLTFRDHNAVEKVAISSSATTTPRPSTASCASARWTAT
jgi:hypothetical protein